MSVIFASIIILGGFGCQKSTEKINSITDTNTSSTTKTQPTGSIRDLLHRGVAQKCTYETPQGEKGTIYTDGKRVYAEIRNAPVPAEIGKNVNMINDGEMMYTWDLATKKGQKLSLATTKDTKGSSSSFMPESSERVDTSMLDSNYDMTCTAWSIDESKFVAPSTVQFVDMSAITEKLNDAKATAQQACANMTGKEKLDCEKALNAFVE